MSDNASQTTVVVPDETKQAFPDIVELILHSESMNDKERMYWINVLPVMKPDQRDNLRQILTDEREQLAAIDRKYNKKIETISSQQTIALMEAERRKKRTERSQVEHSFEAKDEQREEELLKEIEMTGSATTEMKESRDQE